MGLPGKIAAVLAAMLLLAGCSSWDQAFSPSEPPPVENVATQPDIVSVKIAEAAAKASKALDEIAHIDREAHPDIPPMKTDYASAGPNLMQPVSVRWSGPIEQIARTLAERAGMRFHVKGREPPTPLIVNVNAYQEPILHILRDIGLQAGTRADLSIDQNEGVVEVRYAAEDAPR
ncbi:MAG: DotD/TraH family lipoprotein [Alphaproteobacteria bacterium]|nr:DotD/TraH family lipoprotein [Alphaproteobacteria bacterium]